MKGKIVVGALSFLGMVGLALSPCFSLEKLKVATAIKQAPAYYLPLLAAQEMGYWKENGLETDWISFTGGPDMQKAIVIGAVPFGLDTAIAQIMAQSRGVPSIIVADVQNTEAMGLYVLPGSRIKEPRDLKGARIGVTRLGALDHANAQFVAKMFSLEKDVRYVGAGGIPEKIAALRAGGVDAMTMVSLNLMELIVKGTIVELLNTDEYRPKEWLSHLAFAHRNMVTKEPDTLRRAVRAIVKGVQLVRQDARWAKDKMKSFQGYSEEAASKTYNLFRFSPDGRINPKALDNVVTFVKSYNLAPRDKVPPVEELYTNEFVR